LDHRLPEVSLHCVHRGPHRALAGPIRIATPREYDSAVSAAWSLDGAYATEALHLAADSSVLPVIPAGLEPATYALGTSMAVVPERGDRSGRCSPGRPPRRATRRRPGTVRRSSSR